MVGVDARYKPSNKELSSVEVTWFGLGVGGCHLAMSQH